MLLLKERKCEMDKKNEEDSLKYNKELNIKVLKYEFLKSWKIEREKIYLRQKTVKID